MAAFSRFSDWTYLRGALDYHLLNGIYISNNLEQFVLDNAYLVMRSQTEIRSEIKCEIKNKQTKKQHYKQEVCLNFLSLPCHFVISAECSQVSLLNIRWIQVIRRGTQWRHPLRKLWKHFRFMSRKSMGSLLGIQHNDAATTKQINFGLIRLTSSFGVGRNKICHYHYHPFRHSFENIHLFWM